MNHFHLPFLYCWFVDLWLIFVRSTVLHTCNPANVHQLFNFKWFFFRSLSFSPCACRSRSNLWTNFLSNVTSLLELCKKKVLKLKGNTILRLFNIILWELLRYGKWKRWKQQTQYCSRSLCLCVSHFRQTSNRFNRRLEKEVCARMCGRGCSDRSNVDTSSIVFSGNARFIEHNAMANALPTNYKPLSIISGGTAETWESATQFVHINMCNMGKCIEWNVWKI